MGRRTEVSGIYLHGYRITQLSVSIERQNHLPTVTINGCITARGNFHSKTSIFMLAGTALQLAFKEGYTNSCLSVCLFSLTYHCLKNNFQINILEAYVNQSSGE